MTLRILMVEDEVGFSSCYADWMRESGCIFDIAATVAEAVERIQKFEYDLAFVDYHIGIDVGTSLITSIAGHPHAKKLRLYAMTGDARPETIDTCRMAGFIDVLIKPFRHSEFMALIGSETLRATVFG